MEIPGVWSGPMHGKRESMATGVKEILSRLKDRRYVKGTRTWA